MLVTDRIRVLLARNGGSGRADCYFGGSSVEYEMIVEYARERGLYKELEYGLEVR